MPWSISTAYFKVLVLGYYLNRGKYFSDVLEALKQLEVVLRMYISVDLLKFSHFMALALMQTGWYFVSKSLGLFLLQPPGSEK